MALPQAQLGSMPNINLPSSINHSVTKRPSLWEEALGAFLSGTASAAGGQLASNALSRDFTEQAAKEGVVPSDTQAPGFWDKLTGGPGVTRAQLQEGEQRNTANTHFNREMDAKMDEFAKTFGLDKDRLAASVKAQQDDLTLNKDKFAFDKTIRSSEDSRQGLLAGSHIRNEDQRSVRENAKQAPEMRLLNAQSDMLERGGPKLDAETKNLEAEARYRKSEADRNEMMIDRLNKMTTPKGQEQSSHGWMYKLLHGTDTQRTDTPQVMSPDALIARKAAIEQSAGSIQPSQPQPVSAAGAPIERPPAVIVPRPVSITPAPETPVSITAAPETPQITAVGMERPNAYQADMASQGLQDQFGVYDPQSTYPVSAQNEALQRWILNQPLSVQAGLQDQLKTMFDRRALGYQN